MIAGGLAAATVIPRRLDDRVVTALTRLWLLAHPGAVSRLTVAMRERLGRDTVAGEPLHTVAKAHYRSRFQTGWERVRALQGGALTGEVELEGRDLVEEGLAAGRGVILWRMAVGGGPALMSAFHRAGLPLVHLSRAEHGSRHLSRFGLATLCRMWQRAENRFLEERVAIPVDGALDYVRVLTERLAANKVLSIAGEHAGKGGVTVRVLGSERQLATGAAALAWECGARLLTCATVQAAPARRRVVVDPPIELAAGAGRRAAVAGAVEEYARRLELRVRAHPADWRGWGTRLI